MSTEQADQQSQSCSSHMMKTTKRGRPFLKDTLDLFATLIVSLQLTPHKQYFRTFPNSFTTDEAAHNLASLKFSQSNRGPDPRDKSRIVTTTTTTTFSMTRDMAKAMCQHFMDARLIENAADQGSNLFKDRGTYVLTPKGLHVLERFISKNGINADHLQQAFASQPICVRLLHLERRAADDEIIVTQSVITALFRRFVGRQANYLPSQSIPSDTFQEYQERTKGIQLSNIQDKATIPGKGVVTHKYCFSAVSALEWLCDFTSVVGREEAAEMAAQFVRFGLITLVSDKRKNNDSAIIFTVRGSTPGGNSPVSPHGEFRCTAKAIYKITEEGKRVAQWDESTPSPFSSTTNLHGDRASLDSAAVETGSKCGPDAAVSAADAKIHRRISMAEKLHASYEAGEKKGNVKSNMDRLNYILEEPAYRGLFRDFLKANFCEENLAFWLDVEDFKRKFSTTSSAQATASPRLGNVHHECLIQTALQIYHKYLAPSSQHELNIDHGLRLDLASYLGEVITNLNGKSFDGQVNPNHFNATQLQMLIKLYSRIQTHVLRLMATDSLPKFVKTPRFVEARQHLGEGVGANEDVLFLTSPHAPPGLGEEEAGGAYMTVSAKASEQREHRSQISESHTSS
ncbi:regulator of G protein signaling domain-containing protein [Pisolithus orientalis]|uniref:regulator of G protein signaling domain-containing protein n=1 Tax=Pisolithus orientalis TaxID=936130 RepID=UPI00222452C4|nr:regulator of G protein signaling domain-containing protein [Pisolithus orientalis]KAI6035561.1 regulator of G protein signaling domain-containing protein [Pisolithus orientalis]